MPKREMHAVAVLVLVEALVAWGCKKPLRNVSYASGMVIQAPTRSEVAAARKIYCDAGASDAGEPECTGVSATRKSYQLTDASVPPVSPSRDWVHPAFIGPEAFCRNLMFKGQQNYKKFAWLGGIGTIVGSGATAGFAAWAATADGDDRAQITWGAVGAASPAAFPTFCGFLVRRAIAAARASGEAGYALRPGLKDDERWAECLKVRSTYIVANAEALSEPKKDEANADSEGSKAAKKSDAAAFVKWWKTQCDVKLDDPAADAESVTLYYRECCNPIPDKPAADAGVPGASCTPKTITGPKQEDKAARRFLEKEGGLRAFIDRVVWKVEQDWDAKRTIKLSSD